MSTRLLLPGLVLACVLVTVGCARRVVSSGCASPRDCGSGEVCEAGACVAASSGGACTTDAECNASAGEVCNPTTLRCDAGAGGGGAFGGNGNAGTCTKTADCPVDQFCNTTTGLCAALAPGYCRQPSQCPAEASICSASSPSVPGRCVECLTRDDCGGAECVSPGVCSDLRCPANSTPVGGQCRCNSGYEQKPDGTCVAVATDGSAGGGGGDGDGGGGDGDGGGDGGGGGGDTGGGSGPSTGGVCDPQNLGLDCLGPYNACTEQGQCVCDELTLVFVCLLFGEDIDPSSCDCAPLSGGPTGAPPAPAGWTCPADYYGTGDGCDCGCGALDADCNGGGCAEPGCGQAQCGFCYLDAASASAGAPGECGASGGIANEMPPAGWVCDPSWYRDGECDCGCGALDVDCTDGGCATGCGDYDCQWCHDTAYDVCF